MKKKLKFDYDYKNDTLYLYNDEECKESISFFGLVIDVTKNKSIKGIEILNATRFISKLSETKITRDMLKNITLPRIKIKTINELMFIVVNFKVNNRDILLPLSIKP